MCVRFCITIIYRFDQSEERRQAFESDVVSLRKQFNEQSNKHQRTINERDAKINMLLEQYKYSRLTFRFTNVSDSIFLF